MDIAEHIEALQREGDLLATTVAGMDPDTPIPTCPDWVMRDLVRHVGSVHRWAAAHVAQRRAEPIDAVDAVVGELPGDDRLVDWFREGHAALVATLQGAEPDVACWTFLPAPSPLAFWARRQAHETGIHRVDAESPGGSITAFRPAAAVDGIDELLFGFASRRGGRLRADPARTLHLHCTDVEGEWLVRIGPEGGAEVSREHAKGDCAVRGSASDLYLLVWNRRGRDGLQVFGDDAILDLWRESLRVRWGRS
jgi:uncharacterized protein (TIGR03083 family)